jgi:hypothetical protein
VAHCHRELGSIEHCITSFLEVNMAPFGSRRGDGKLAG